MNTTIEDKIQKLPPELQQELENFLDSLIRTLEKDKPKKLSLDWAGGLKEFRDQYTSLELQKKPLSGGVIECIFLMLMYSSNML